MAAQRQTGTEDLDWVPQAGDFPARGSVEDGIRFCLGYAVLAPSPHNSQPWWFAVDDDAVTIGLDLSRGLAVVDPHDRESTMSIGAALATLRIALAHFGFSTEVAYWPDPKDPEACATVTARPGAASEDDVEMLFDQITVRRTSHAAFEDMPVDLATQQTLYTELEGTGVDAHPVTDPADRQRVAELVSEADRLQMADPRHRRELASWLRRPLSRQRDGLHGFTMRSPMEEVALASPLVVRTFDTGSQRAARDDELIAGSPLLLILSTEGDDRDDWLAAGQVLARLLLRASAAGLSVGFLNQPIEIPEVREHIRKLTGGAGFPQMLLRIGYGPAANAQPRRALEHFVVD